MCTLSFTWRLNGSLVLPGRQYCALLKGEAPLVPISMDAMQADFLRTQNTSGCKTLGDPPIKSWADSNCYVGGGSYRALHTQLHTT